MSAINGKIIGDDLGIVSKKNNDFWFVILGAFIVMQFILVGILYFQNMEKNQQLEILHKDYVNKNLITFEQLPQKIKVMYELRSQKGQLLELLEENQDYIVSIQSEDDEQVVYQDNQKVVFVKEMECADMSIGKEEITPTCDVKLTQFFASFTQEMVYEIVALVQNDDLLKMSNIKDLLNSQTYQKYETDPLIFTDLVKYINHGLGLTRMHLAISAINDRVRDPYIKLSPFYFFTQGKSGFKIKAYNLL